MIARVFAALLLSSLLIAQGYAPAMAGVTDPFSDDLAILMRDAPTGFPHFRDRQRPLKGATKCWIERDLSGIGFICTFPALESYSSALAFYNQMVSTLHRDLPSARVSVWISNNQVPYYCYSDLTYFNAPVLVHFGLAISAGPALYTPELRIYDR